MTRLALIADLHFGREIRHLLPHLLAAIEAARPDHIVIAGDFVQRARASHFHLARAFLDRLQAPWIAVPGNHDVPLYDLVSRLLWPRAAYRRHISQDTEPTVQTEMATLIGIDTTDPLRVQRGRIDQAQIDRVCAEIETDDGRLPVVIAHHPFHQNPEVEKNLMRGAARALEAWSDCGPHVILSGHLHSFLVEPFVTRKGAGQTLQVHCGSSTSTRHRGNPNDLAILDILGSEVDIARHTFDPEQGFTLHSRYSYAATTSGWVVNRDRP